MTTAAASSARRLVVIGWCGGAQQQAADAAIEIERDIPRQVSAAVGWFWL